MAAHAVLPRRIVKPLDGLAMDDLGSG